MNYAALRKRMVKEQLAARGIKNKRVLGAFLEIERHKFVPPLLEESAYADSPLSIGEGQTISQPYMVALISECLDISGTDRVLEIGTGSGYQAAILSRLAKQVYSVERNPILAQRAQALLSLMGYNNIKIRVGDGSLGWEEEAPFDKIAVTAASPDIPGPLTGQLEEGGRLVIPLGQSFSQVLTLVEKHAGKIKESEICSCVFVPLVGKYAFNEKYA